MSEYTPTTAHVREVFSNRPGCDYVKQRLEFNRWLWSQNAKLVTEFMQQPEFQEMLAARDAATRTATLEDAAGIAEGELFWDPRGEVLSSDEVAYNVACREVSRAIRAAAVKP